MAKKTKPTEPTFLPGMEPVVIKELEDAVNDYWDRSKWRKEHAEEERRAKDKAIDALIDNGLKVYKTQRGIKLEVSSKTDAKVSFVGGADAN